MQWHQMDHMQAIWTSPRSWQKTTPTSHRSIFLQAGCSSCNPTNSVKALKAQSIAQSIRKTTVDQRSMSDRQRYYVHKRWTPSLPPASTAPRRTPRRTSSQLTWQWKPTIIQSKKSRLAYRHVHRMLRGCYRVVVQRVYLMDVNVQVYMCCCHRHRLIIGEHHTGRIKIKPYHAMSCNLTSRVARKQCIVAGAQMRYISVKPCTRTIRRWIGVGVCVKCQSVSR